MSHLTFLADNLADTDRLGAALAELLPVPATVALIGTLGAGKTRLVQAAAAACGIPREDVVSPTFVLCQEYQGPRTIVHCDVYRLRGDDEFLQLGPEEFFDSPALVFIEWADRLDRALPDERLEIRIEVVGDEQRRFDIAARGARYQPILRLLRERLTGT